MNIGKSTVKALVYVQQMVRKWFREIYAMLHEFEYLKMFFFGLYFFHGIVTFPIISWHIMFLPVVVVDKKRKKKKKLATTEIHVQSSSGEHNDIAIGSQEEALEEVKCW